MRRESAQRFREIVKVLAFYGFGYLVDSSLKKTENLPKNLRKAFEELGPTFIKIGQILSTRSDILPSDYIDELSKLQDNVRPESFSHINRVFMSEFLEPIDEMFLYFDKKPLASASIAQVHSATLKDGKEVIVKIQRPDIYEKMKLDISILKKIIHLTKAKFSDSLIAPEEALNEILAATELELNFKNEAENAEKFLDFNKEVAFIYTPFIVHNLTSTRVITMEKIDGFKITDMTALKDAGYDLDDIGKKLALSYLKQVFTDGFFHGDPHPGNLLIKQNKICYIDFGIMGYLTKSLRSALNEAIEAVAYKDINKLISVILAIGTQKGYVDKNKLYEDIEYLFDSYLYASLKNIKISHVLEEVFDMAKRNNITLPKDLTLLVRGFIIMEGVVAKIAPDINILDVAIPFVKYNSSFSIFDHFNFDELLFKSYAFIKDSFKIPSRVLQLCDNLLNGRGKFQIEVKNLGSSLNELNKMANRLVFGLVVSSLILCSSVILNSNIGPKIYGISIMGITVFLIAGFMGLWLLISIIRSGKM